MANERTKIKLQRLKQYMKMIKSNKNLYEKVSDLYDKYQINENKLSFFQKRKAKSYLRQANKNQVAFDNFYKENKNLIEDTYGGIKDKNHQSEFKEIDRKDLLSEINKDKNKDLKDKIFANRNSNVTFYVEYNQEILGEMLNIKKEAQQISNDKTDNPKNNFTTPVNSNKKQNNHIKNQSIQQEKQQVTTNSRHFKL